MTTTWCEQLTTAWCNVLEIGAPPRPILEFTRTLKVWARDQATGQDRWEPFDPDSHPAQREIILAFMRGGFDELTVLGPVQDGKTFACIIACLLYCLIELKQSAGLMLPDKDKAMEVWLEKIKPVIEASGYDWILPNEGRGARGGGAGFLRLNTGATIYLLGAGASNESAQSSFTCRFMFVDEASKIRAKFITLAWGRTASYDQHARKNRTSTISDDTNDSTIAAYDDSTQSRNYFRCPLCAESNHPTGGWQVFDFAGAPATDGKIDKYARLHYDPDTDETARDTARLVCAHDATHLLTDEQRRHALRNYRHLSMGQTLTPTGAITGATMGSSRKGIKWCSMESPIKTLGQLAKNLRQAIVARDTKGNHEQLRQFTRDECVTVYTGDRDNADQHHVLRCIYLAARSAGSDYHLSRHEREEEGDSIHAVGTPPQNIDWYTVGVDVNPGGARAPGRLYWLMQGGNGLSQSFDVAWGTVALSKPGNEANTQELHDGLTRLRAQLIELAKNYGRPLAGVAVDVGDRQDEINQWLARHHDWTPIKDHAGQGLSVETTYSLNGNTLQKPLSRSDLAGWLHWRWQKDAYSNNRGWWLAIVDSDEVRHQTQMSFLVPANQPGAHHLPSGLLAKDTIIAHYCATGRVPDASTKDGWRWADRKADRAIWPDWQSRRDYLACSTYAAALDYHHRRKLTRPPPRTVKYGVVGKVGA
jgi:hypothetical protein